MNFKSTRQLNCHDGSSVCPVTGEGYDIIAIDIHGVEHHSAGSEHDYHNWLWTDIMFWRYDDASLIDIMTTKIAVLQDVIRDTRQIVADGAMTGFNCHDGDWAERLFYNNGTLTRALKEAGI